MKNKFIREVMKNLPRNRRKEIRRDLEEAFASAMEHGESEAAVIERLGTPEDFACSLTGSSRRSPSFKAAILLLIPSLLCLSVCVPALIRKSSEHIIGGAVSMTDIVVAAEGLVLTQLFFQIGLILLTCSAVLFIKTGIKRRREAK